MVQDEQEKWDIVIKASVRFVPVGSGRGMAV